MPAHLIAEEGPLQGLLFDLSEGESWILGRDPDEAQFVLEDATVSRKHAKLTRRDDGIYFENLSQINPALVNERDEETLLQEGDRIQIGQTTFLFSEEPLSENPPAMKGGYDDIFGNVEEPPPPPEEEEEVVPEPPRPRGEAEETPYDTIFEDTTSEEDLPVNLLSPSPLLLKVVAGPNSGAEIGIEKGRSYTIGKDSNQCDIVFQDLSVSREHTRLSVSPDGVMEIEDLGSKNGTFINGNLVTEKKIISPQDLISAGTTTFVLIDRDAPQETIYSPSIPAYEPFRKEEPLAEEAPLELATVAEEDWKKRPLPMKHVVIGSCLLFIAFIVFISFFSLFKSDGIVIAEKQPNAQIQEAIAKFQDVQFSFNPASGKLFVVGHVITAVDFQELTYQLSQIPFIQSVENNVVIDELVCKMNNDVLSTNPTWRAVSIQAPQAGQFVVTGYLETNEQNSALAEYLTVNFPYLDRLQNRVVVEENLNTQLQSLFAKNGFGAVTYQLSNGEVILSGRYSNQMEKEFDKLVKELNMLPGVARVTNFAIATSPNAAGIDLSQQYVVTGAATHDGSGYSAILNGKIYTVGGMVDGMQITSIESSTILLEKDGLKYKINYTR